MFLFDRVLALARRPAAATQLAVKRTGEFVAYVDHIWRLVEDDVRVSVIEEYPRAELRGSQERAPSPEG